jgi:hypothetical protein
MGYPETFPNLENTFIKKIDGKFNETLKIIKELVKCANREFLRLLLAQALCEKQQSAATHEHL